MSRIAVPLTDTKIRQARPKAKEYNLGDGDGLYLRIRPNGTKSWVFNYFRPHTSVRANLSLGHYPTISLVGARKKRQHMLEMLSDEIDPKDLQLQQKAINRDAHEATFERVFNAWIKIKQSKVTENYASDIENSMRLHIFPLLGTVPVHKIRAASVIEILQPLASRGSLETVKRLCQRLNEVMTYAVNTGLIDANSLLGIKAAFESPSRTNLPTLRPGQLPELIKKLNRAHIRITTRCLIEWQLHTMVRPSEAAGTRWSEFDDACSIWTIPPVRMKRKREHLVPLSDHARELLDLMRPISGHREFVFPSERNPRTHTNPQTANMALKRMGFHRQLVAHGLRALASTTLNEKGFDADLIETALAHCDKNTTRSAYNRADYIVRRAEMMTWWSDHIAKASIGNLSLSNQFCLS